MKTFRFLQTSPVLLLLLVAGAQALQMSTSSSDEESEQLPKPSQTEPQTQSIEEDCGPDQFYYEPRSRCRNCSDISQVFQSYQEWLGREVSETRRSDGGLNTNGATQTNNNNNNGQLNFGRFSTTTTTHQEGLTRFASGDVLSRLISIDPQYQEYIDSSSNQNSLFNEGSEFGSSASNAAPADGYAPMSSSSATGSEMSTSHQQHNSNDLINLTKQTQKFVSKLIRSNLINNELLTAMDQCRQQQNATSCQMWSNMCVMTMYSYSDIPSLSSSSSSLPSTSSAPSSLSSRRKVSSYDSHSSSSLSTAPQMSRQNNYELINQQPNSIRRKQRKIWQQCRQFNTESICNGLRDWFRVERKSGSADIQNIYASVDEPLAKVGSGQAFKLNQAIQLLTYKYSLDGNLLGVEQFGLGDMERFCLISDQNLVGLNEATFETRFIRLGRNAKLRCYFDSNQASLFANKHFNETVFIDLYIGYALNGAMFVKPVPILIKNLLYNGVQVNRKHEKDSTRWKLVHRFFFHSTLDMLASNIPGEDSEHNVAADKKQQRVVLYAKSVSLEFKFRKQEKGALLSALLLTIDYGQLVIRSNNVNINIIPPPTTVETSGNNSYSSSEANFHYSPIFESTISISQTLIDMQTFKKDLDLVMTILSILSSIWSLIKCYNIQKCYGVVKLELDSLIRFIIIGCDTVANLFATVTLLFLAHLFVTLKLQSSVQVLSLNEELENALIVNLQLAFVFKLIGLAQKLYVQLSADIFFIDWERPKMLTSSQILNHNSLYKAQNADNKGNNQNELNNQETFIKFNQQQQQQQSSFWRPYTVANRWLQMQTMRRSNLTTHLLLFVCLIETTQLTNLATADLNLNLSWPNALHLPDNDLNDSIRQQQIHLLPYVSVVFRMLILSIVYLALSFGQFFYKKYFHEPMIRNTVSEFVDLCSVANVSLFAMLYPRFGYYIHGRNANGSGDCGIAEMNALLEREERELCSKRGLAPNSDQQTFILILPRIINDHYRKLLLRDDLLALVSTSSSLSNQVPLNKQLGTNNNIGGNSRFAVAGNNLLRSALNFSSSSSSGADTRPPHSRSFGGSSNRAVIEIIVAKNKAINAFLTSFLEHIYKDIDYSIRERRRFESLLLDVDFDNENSAARNGPLAPTSTLDHQSSTAATFCKDNNDSFMALLLLSLEADLILVELFALLILDLWLGQPSMIITASLIWFLHQSFKLLYGACARHNLVTKALIDEKFLALK